MWKILNENNQEEDYQLKSLHCIWSDDWSRGKFNNSIHKMRWATNNNNNNNDQQTNKHENKMLNWPLHEAWNTFWTLNFLNTMDFNSTKLFETKRTNKEFLLELTETLRVITMAKRTNEWRTIQNKTKQNKTKQNKKRDEQLKNEEMHWRWRGRGQKTKQKTKPQKKHRKQEAIEDDGKKKQNNHKMGQLGGGVWREKEGINEMTEMTTSSTNQPTNYSPKNNHNTNISSLPHPHPTLIFCFHSLNSTAQLPAEREREKRERPASILPTNSINKQTNKQTIWVHHTQGTHTRGWELRAAQPQPQ